MTDEELAKANEIKKEINELEEFLRVAEKVWTGKIIKKTSTITLLSNAYGVYSEAEYHLKTDIKNKVLDVLKEHLDSLKQKLSDM